MRTDLVFLLVECFSQAILLVRQAGYAYSIIKLLAHNNTSTHELKWCNVLTIFSMEMHCS